MGRYGIDYGSVREAAETLQKAGEAVTVERVRATLGSGSFTTLGKHLRAWRRTQEPTEPAGVALPELINDAAQTVWANLSRAADLRIEEARAAAQSAVAAVQDTCDARVAAAHEELQEAQRAHKQLACGLSEKLAEARQLLADREERLHKTEAARAQADIQVGQGEVAVQQLSQRLQEAQALAQQERLERTRLHTALERLQTERSELEQQQQQRLDALLLGQAAQERRTVASTQQQEAITSALGALAAQGEARAEQLQGQQQRLQAALSALAQHVTDSSVGQNRRLEAMQAGLAKLQAGLDVSVEEAAHQASAAVMRQNDARWSTAFGHLEKSLFDALSLAVSRVPSSGSIAE